MRDVDPSCVPTYATVFGDTTDFEVSGVLDWWYVFRVRSRRRFIEFDRSLLSERFMRSVVVESVYELVEASLLGGEVR